jgi:hypothetical protein
VHARLDGWRFSTPNAVAAALDSLCNHQGYPPEEFARLLQLAKRPLVGGSNELASLGGWHTRGPQRPQDSELVRSVLQPG